MNIDVYTATGTKKGTATLPKDLFEVAVNEGLMHQFLVMQQSNRRHAIASSKTRGEISGSTRKLFAQKGTGRARRGPIRSPLLRGGNKAFGPKKNRNFTKDMPKSMRRRALTSCLSLKAKHGTIIGLESYPDAIKTKDALALLTKLPVEIGRSVLFVLPEPHDSLTLSLRNIPGAKTVLAAYLNPEDILKAWHMVFVGDALKKAEKIFGKKTKEAVTKKVEEKITKEPTTKKPAAKKPAAKKPAAKATKKPAAKKPSTPSKS